MINLEHAHKYVQSIFHSALVAHEDNNYIEEQLDKFYPYHKSITIIRENQSDVYLLETESQRIAAHNGTRGTFPDWMNNFKAWTNKYFHDGISDEYYKNVSKIVLDFARRCKIPFMNYGHSQGDCDAELATLDIREHWSGVDVETIGWCGPYLYTGAGVTRMKQNKCRVTKGVMPGDLVAKVGGIEIDWKRLKIEWARNYGYIVKLPEVEKHIVMGHAWSNVMESIARLFINWKMPEQIQYIDAIKCICKL
jgi:hypothetical protein